MKNYIHTNNMKIIADDANGAKQSLDALFRSRCITKELTRELVKYLFTKIKRYFKNYPFESQEEKDVKIHTT